MMLPKYKAWDTRQKVMYFPKELAQDGMTLSVDGRGFVNVSGTSAKFDEYYPHLIPLQSTGLTDKNGTEIFAGDILRTDEAGWVGKVVYRYGHYMLVDDDGGFSGEPNWKACEIIGTIHQHPELLDWRASHDQTRQALVDNCSAAQSKP